MVIEDGRSEGLYRSVFDAMPSLVFVVDNDVRIQQFNAAAADLLSMGGMSIMKNRAGEVLHCLHSADVPEGCGRAPHCKNCIIRNSVIDACRGSRIVRRRTKIVMSHEGENRDMYALISASPFVYHEEPLVLLVIEDISDIEQIQRMIPICAVCKKVRDDRESWVRLEAYFRDHWDMDFSHGLCPDCHRAELDKLEKKYSSPGTRNQAGAGFFRQEHACRTVQFFTTAGFLICFSCRRPALVSWHR